jgi:hypothetical protein
MNTVERAVLRVLSGSLSTAKLNSRIRHFNLVIH